MNQRENFNETIERNRTATAAPVSITEISAGRSVLAVRQRGCFITKCALISPTSGDSVDILFAEEDLGVPKLMATHVMTPAGPYEGTGGQHGFARWADYSVTENNPASGTLSLQTKRSDGSILLSKKFVLGESALQSETSIFNPDTEPLRTSIGEHYYYPLPDASTEGLTIDDQTIDELLGTGTLEQIMAGDAAFWDTYPGKADIHFPAGYTLRLEASVDPDTTLGMLLWHKPGSETICFEPTAGYRHHVMNTCLCLEQGETATLKSSLTLV